MRIWVIGIFLFPLFSIGQQSFLPLHSYFKDELWRNRATSYTGGSFLPINEADYHLNSIIRDSSLQYYLIAQKLYKEYLVEIKGEGYKINLSPILDVSVGKDYADSLDRKLFNNTRGLLIQVNLLDKISFYTSYYENQNRFTQYENIYYSSLGERYPDPDSTYHIENGVVPGAARTKPFKVDGYDYGYAIGNVVYRAKPNLQFSMGNNTSFIGKGYRSLFLSDNSVPSTYFRTDLQLGKRISYTIHRSKVINLLRRPYRTTVESYYEPKLFSSQFLTAKLSEKVQISFFEGSMWSLGDSVSYRSVDGAYYLPLPFLASSIVNNPNLVHSINGFQLEATIFNSQFYSQIAVQNWNFDRALFQAGVRKYHRILSSENMLQLEFNSVPKNIYQTSNSRINYTVYNLPFAHPKGQGFQEYILRYTANYKRYYLDIKSIYYELSHYASGDLIVANNKLITSNGSAFHQQLEAGYRFNKKLNFTAFIKYTYRESNSDNWPKSSNILVGIRTGLLNHYNDF